MRSLMITSWKTAKITSWRVMSRMRDTPSSFTATNSNECTKTTVMSMGRNKIVTAIKATKVRRWKGATTVKGLRKKVNTIKRALVSVSLMTICRFIMGMIIPTIIKSNHFSMIKVSFQILIKIYSTSSLTNSKGI